MSICVATGNFGSTPIGALIDLLLRTPCGVLQMRLFPSSGVGLGLRVSPSAGGGTLQTFIRISAVGSPRFAPVILLLFACRLSSSSRVPLAQMYPALAEPPPRPLRAPRPCLLSSSSDPAHPQAERLPGGQGEARGRHRRGPPQLLQAARRGAVSAVREGRREVRHNAPQRQVGGSRSDGPS